MVDHIVILDGTMSTLLPGQETNAGRTYLLLKELTPSPRLSVYYEAGIQWQGWRHAKDVLDGRGIDQQIRRAYGFVASHYHPGDRIFLFGYSRGAFAVRSLAGVIDRVGLLKAEHATARNVVMAYRHYQLTPARDAAEAFRRLLCHDRIEIEMIGVWDTVRALGLPLPVIRRFARPKYGFHNQELGPLIRRGFHALALNETRVAYEPVLWRTSEGHTGRVEQVWFRGAHSDVGGMIGTKEEARPLANIPLVWILEGAIRCGLMLPEGWRERFSCDAEAPQVGSWAGIGMLFWHRRPRIVGTDPSEAVHPTASDWTRSSTTGPWPRNLVHSERHRRSGGPDLNLSPLRSVEENASKAEGGCSERVWRDRSGFNRSGLIRYIPRRSTQRLLASLRNLEVLRSLNHSRFERGSSSMKEPARQFTVEVKQRRRFRMLRTLANGKEGIRRKLPLTQYVHARDDETTRTEPIDDSEPN